MTQKLLFAALLACASSLDAAEIAPVFVKASESSFSRPHDLVLSPDERYLYVADVGNDAVKVLDPHTLEVRGLIGQGELSSPHDVAFDKAGRLLVADSGNDRIVIYSVRGARGKFVEAWSQDLGSPEGVAPGPDGRVYVTNASLNDVVVFSNGQVVARAGSRGGGEIQFARPHDVEVDAMGKVYVVDPGNNRIQILNAKLEFVSSLGGAPYGFNEPKYLAFDGRGRLYVADEYNNQIKIFDTERRLTGVIGTGERGAGRNQLNQPEGVEVSGDLIWVSDTYNNRILLYRR